MNMRDDMTGDIQGWKLSHRGCVVFVKHRYTHHHVLSDLLKIEQGVGQSLLKYSQQLK